MLRVVFTVSTMSAAPFHFIAGVPATRGKSNLMFASVGFLTCSGNCAATVPSSAYPHANVVVDIHLLTVCHVRTAGPDTPTAATITIF